jgi:hypothetical protein
VIAQVHHTEDGTPRIENADPFPEELIRAIRTVQPDLRLPDNWMNHLVAKRWEAGLPPEILSDVSCESYDGLLVGLVSRQSQITLKLFAAVDLGERSVHMQDLLSLRPTPHELATAAAWVLTQDAGPDFPQSVTETVDYVTRNTQ